MVVSSATSRALSERAARVIPGGNSRLTIASAAPVYVQSASGAWLQSVDGDEILDCINNYTSLIHGHAQPEVAQALDEQSRRLGAVSFPTEIEIVWAEEITSRSPALELIRFCNSGTEAVMLAVKAARAFTGRGRIAKVEGAYHGAYDLVEVSQGSRPENWGSLDEPAAVPYALGTPTSVTESVVVLPFNDVDRSLAILERQRADLAAVLIDPSPQRIGLFEISQEYAAALSDFCRRTGCLLIFDEVISFRRSFSGAHGLLGIRPDLVTLGKIIGGGLPAGAVAGRREVMSVFDHSRGYPAVPHGGTFNANALTAAAGLAALRLLDRATFDRLDGFARTAVAKLEGLVLELGLPIAVRRVGSLFKVHATQRQTSEYRSAFLDPSEAALEAAIYDALLAQGLALGRGLFGCFSTVMGEVEMRAFETRMRAGLEDVREVMDRSARSARRKAMGGF